MCSSDLFSRIKDRCDSDLNFIQQNSIEFRNEVLLETEKEIRKREQGKSHYVSKKHQLNDADLITDIKKNARYPIFKLLLLIFFLFRTNNWHSYHEATELKEQGYVLMHKQYLVMFYGGIFIWFVAVLTLSKYFLEF